MTTPAADPCHGNTGGVILIDATDDALTLSWPSSSVTTTGPTTTPTPTTTLYEVQYRSDHNDDDTDEFVTVSKQIRTTTVRKKNLRRSVDGLDRYTFRVRESKENTATTQDANAVSPPWMSHATPFALLSTQAHENRLAAPIVTLGGSHESLHIAWPQNTHRRNANDNNNNNNHTDDDQRYYELQMREHVGGSAWTTIASAVRGRQVRKKNLSSSWGYQFRVRLATATSNDKNDNNDNNDNNSTMEPTTTAFSQPCDPVVALGYTTGLRRFLSGVSSVLSSSNSNVVPVEQALGGKEFVLLYASAHWCGPCRQFTPQLSAWYNNHNNNGRIGHGTVEVVFLSADHDANSFASYYATMPWLAVDYDDSVREQLLAQIRVQGIPRLAVIDGRTGRMVEDNAVGTVLDVTRWRSLAAAAAGR